MQANKRDLLNRLATIEGHLKGIHKMVDEDQYCVDILKQSYGVGQVAPSGPPAVQAPTAGGQVEAEASDGALVVGAQPPQPPQPPQPVDEHRRAREREAADLKRRWQVSLAVGLAMMALMYLPL